MTRTTRQMFGKLERELAADARLEKEAQQDAERRWEREEARLDEPLTRREVLEAIESVAHKYGMHGNHDADLICDALRKLAEALQ